jgi:hypothetical protein
MMSRLWRAPVMYNSPSIFPNQTRFPVRRVQPTNRLLLSLPLVARHDLRALRQW